MKTIIAALFLTAAARPALATDLVNHDSKAYSVTLVEGSVTVEKNDRVAIEGGALKKK